MIVVFICVCWMHQKHIQSCYLSLFNKLKLRNMCPTILIFLMCTYQRQSGMVNWNGECSSILSVGHCFKQGGVLLSVLFTVYLEILIDQVRKKGLCCHFNGNFVGCFIYTDDITLLAPSRDAFNNMLDVCREYAEAYDILFNATKTKCMFSIELIVLCLMKTFNVWEALYVLLINVFFRILFLVIY